MDTDSTIEMRENVQHTRIGVTSNMVLAFDITSEIRDLAKGALRTAVGRGLALDKHFGSTEDGRLQADLVKRDMSVNPELKPVFVKVDSQSTVQQLVDPLTDTVGTLYHKLRLRRLLGSGDGTMQFKGRVLEFTQSLAFYGIGAISTVMYVPRLRGGVQMIAQDELKLELWQESCRIFGLPVSGNKDEIYERVRERTALSKVMPELKDHTLPQLKEICRLYHLNGFSTLKKDDLITHIQRGVGKPVQGDENTKENRSVHSAASSSSAFWTTEPRQCLPAPPPAAPPTSKPDAEGKFLHGINFAVDEMKMLCDFFRLPVGGNKTQLVTRLKPVVSAEMAALLVEHEEADLKMAQLRELANPLGLKAKDAYTLQIGLSHAGIGPNAILSASQPLSPSGMKPKNSFDFQGVVAPVKLLGFPDVPKAVIAPDAKMKPCRFYCMGCCKRGDSCTYLHTSIKPLSITEPVKRAILDAASFAFSKYYKMPYLEMPDSYDGDYFSYYADWESVFGVERPNHGLCSSLRKAMLVPATCDALGFKPSEKMLIAMMVTMIFEVVGRESEAGYRDCPKTYSRYKAKSVRACRDYASKQPWFTEVCIDALENMYYESRSAQAEEVQQVFEIVHELDLFRCYDEDKMREKVDSIARLIGGKACYELVLRAENQLLATGDRLPFSMVWNRLSDYSENLFPPCSKDPNFCLEQLANIPLVPTRVSKKVLHLAAPAPSVAVKPAPKEPAPSALKAVPKVTSKPVSAPTSRTLRDSAFVREYTAVNVPSFQDELMLSVRKLVAWYAQQNGYDQKLVIDYFERVQKNAFKAGKEEQYKSDSIPFIAVRLWTTAERFADKVELCSILNKALRDDCSEIMALVAVIVRALNMQCVSRLSGKHIKWPKSNVTYRGTNMPRAAMMWYTQGKEYRVPMYLATSSDEEKAEEFMRGGAGIEPVMFIFHFDKVKRCKHVNFVDKTDGTVKGEKEFLFAPYSVFTVRRVEVVKEAKVTCFERVFHIIEVDVAYDNAKHSLDLPLAEWA